MQGVRIDCKNRRLYKRAAGGWRMILMERDGYSCYRCHKHIDKTIDFCYCDECFDKVWVRKEDVSERLREHFKKLPERFRESIEIFIRKELSEKEEK